MALTDVQKVLVLTETRRRIKTRFTPEQMISYMGCWDHLSDLAGELGFSWEDQRCMYASDPIWLYCHPNENGATVVCVLYDLAGPAERMLQGLTGRLTGMFWNSPFYPDLDGSWQGEAEVRFLVSALRGKKGD